MTNEGLLEVPLSALQHFTYCPRQCALIHVEQTFDENVFTVRGRLAHQRSDMAQEECEMRPDGTRVRVARAVSLVSERLGLIGRADVVEFPDGAPPYPVEYKSGRRRRLPPHPSSLPLMGARARGYPDDVQLCGQALCLEEMLSVAVPRGAIYHIASRRRREVVFDDELRALTLQTIEAVRTLLVAQRVPPPVFDRRCRDCSLKEACMPETLEETSDLERQYQQLWEVTP